MTVFRDGIFRNDGADTRAKKVSGLGRWYKSLFGWIAAQIPVQPHKCSAFGLRGVAVRMHWSTAADQPKSYESCLTVVTLIEGCPRKRNSAKQALRPAFLLSGGDRHSGMGRMGTSPRIRNPRLRDSLDKDFACRFAPMIGSRAR